MNARDELDELRQRVWALEQRVARLEQRVAKLEAREAVTATHRRPSGEMRLELEKADTQPSPAPTEAGEAFRSATEKLGG